MYPWAIVEIARAYRFRNIGGTSVGAMAAALAAAAEYGRRNGNDFAFEPLRRLPGALGETLPDRRTRMLSLFQTNPRGRRLLELWRRLGKGRVLGDNEADPTDKQRPMLRAAGGVWRVVLSVVRAYVEPLMWIALTATAIGVVVWWLIGVHGHGSPWLWAILLLVVCLAGALVAFACVLWSDVKEGVIDNNLGLCKGGTMEPPEAKRPGIVEWLHEGIQASAGMKKSDPPLTFRDLWCAPAYPGAEGLPCSEHDPPDRRSINLQMITTNVTHGRPYRLPMFDETSRLFYRATDLEGYFPKPIIDAMVQVSRPYRLLSKSDAAEGPETQGFLELPGADMPIVVAARLSLSYPLLFSAVPLWAIDYEREEGQRELKRCLFTDGGVSSNFPIHLFDSALPRWPTFGMWLDRLDPDGPSAKPPTEAERSRSADGFPDAPEEQSERRDDDVWLPEPIGEGWSDSWKRFDPFAAYAWSELPPAMPVGLLPNLKFLRWLSRWHPRKRDRVARPHQLSPATRSQPRRPADAAQGRGRPQHRHAACADPEDGAPLRHQDRPGLRRAFRRQRGTSVALVAGAAMDANGAAVSRSARAADESSREHRVDGRRHGTDRRGDRAGGAVSAPPRPRPKPEAQALGSRGDAHTAR